MCNLHLTFILNVFSSSSFPCTIITLLPSIFLCLTFFSVSMFVSYLSQFSLYLLFSFLPFIHSCFFKSPIFLPNTNCTLSYFHLCAFLLPIQLTVLLSHRFPLWVLSYKNLSSILLVQSFIYSDSHLLRVTNSPRLSTSLVLSSASLLPYAYAVFELHPSNSYDIFFIFPTR